MRDPKFETPGVFAGRIGIRSRETTIQWMTWDHCLELAVVRYWQIRSQPKTKAAA